MRPERGTLVRQTRAFALQALSEPSYVLYTCRLKNEAKCVPEQVDTPYFHQFCLEIYTSGSFLKDVGTHVYHQFTCWVQLKISVLQLEVDERQWPWDPGRDLSNLPINGNIYRSPYILKFSDVYGTGVPCSRVLQ